MSFKADEFQANYQKRGGTLNSSRSYRSYLNLLDRGLGGLDERITELGQEGVMAWARANIDSNMHASPGSVRSALKRYLQFRLETYGLDAAEDLALDPDIAEAIVEKNEAERALFRFESELQKAVRIDIADLEAGIVIADGGYEHSVATGRTDILCTNAAGEPVVIELKVGDCPKGALEQLLGYAHNVEVETEQPTHAILVAGSFPERIRAAAKRVPRLKLVTYRMKVEFLGDQEDPARG